MQKIYITITKNTATQVVTDASPYRLAGILVHERDGVKRVICYASRSLS